MVRICLSVLLLAVLLFRGAQAQDAEEPKAEAKSPQDELYEAEKEWKALNKELDDLAKQYRESSALERTALRIKYEEAVKLADAHIPKLGTAAEKVYRTAPNEDEKVARMLLGEVSAPDTSEPPPSP